MRLWQKICTGWGLCLYPGPRCGGFSALAWPCRGVSTGAGADFKMQCSPDLCLGGTAALQIISFCTPKSASLRHLYLSDLSVTLSTVLSLSMSFSVCSDSQFHAFCLSSATCFSVCCSSWYCWDQNWHHSAVWGFLFVCGFLSHGSLYF